MSVLCHIIFILLYFILLYIILSFIFTFIFSFTFCTYYCICTYYFIVLKCEFVSCSSVSTIFFLFLIFISLYIRLLTVFCIRLSSLVSFSLFSRLSTIVFFVSATPFMQILMATTTKLQVIVSYRLRLLSYVDDPACILLLSFLPFAILFLLALFWNQIGRERGRKMTRLFYREPVDFHEKYRAIATSVNVNRPWNSITVMINEQMIIRVISILIFSCKSGNDKCSECKNSLFNFWRVKWVFCASSELQRYSCLENK